MIELTYQVVEGTPITMHFKTWKGLNKFVKKEEIKKYKIQAKEKGGHIKIQHIQLRDREEEGLRKYD